jgi:hypothetical protein
LATLPISADLLGVEKTAQCGIARIQVVVAEVARVILQVDEIHQIDGNGTSQRIVIEVDEPQSAEIPQFRGNDT